MQMKHTTAPIILLRTTTATNILASYSKTKCNCIYVCMYLCMYICMYICMYLCIYVYMYVYEGFEGFEALQAL